MLMRTKKKAGIIAGILAVAVLISAVFVSASKLSRLILNRSEASVSVCLTT